jgi:hypothetical protein
MLLIDAIRRGKQKSQITIKNTQKTEKVEVVGVLNLTYLKPNG